MIDNNIYLSKDLQFKVKLFTDLKKKKVALTCI